MSCSACACLASTQVVELARAGYDVGYTYRNSPACAQLGAGRGYAVDLCTGDGLEGCLDDLGPARLPTPGEGK